MPQLNVKALLQQVIESNFNVSDIPKILMGCLPQDIYQLSLDEKRVLSDFIIQQLEQSKPVSWCTHLDTRRCQELLGV